MPRGYKTLPDGREVALTSKEYRNFLDANPGARASKVKVRKQAPPPPPPADVSNAETLAFDRDIFLPDPPKQVDIESAPAPSKKSKGDVQSDFDDLLNLIKASYAGAAAVTGWDGWCLSEAEAQNIARPANNILKRHKAIDKVVRQVVDPVALFAAVAFPTSMRFIMWQNLVKQKQAHDRAQKPHLVKDVTRPEAPPPPSPDIPPEKAQRQMAIDQALERVMNAS